MTRPEIEPWSPRPWANTRPKANEQVLNTYCRCTQLNDSTALFLIIQFIISHFFAHSLNLKKVAFDPGVATPGQCIPWSDGNGGVHRIPKSFSITEASPSDCLMSYLGHSLSGRSYSAEMELAYSIAPAECAGLKLCADIKEMGWLKKENILVDHEKRQIVRIENLKQFIRKI